MQTSRNGDERTLGKPTSRHEAESVSAPNAALATPDPLLIAEVDAAIAAQRDRLIALSHDIHSEPELAFEEFRSVAKTIEPLREHGFRIESGVADLPTAFTAEYGSGDLVS
ncbi:hypothetical protein NS506_07334 [Nocardia seriolae]|uniref:Amidohydrolase n=1 Tax=Nocardia seriolae TaxID=37332 RepID=A0ABC8B4H0_9NOCA|nr:hypothetical protein [Nocardia seriolae]APB01354.1 hypothetical protein NS506_07334 [Nocardia seriolae]